MSPTDVDIDALDEAYVYLLARALVVRQEIDDLSGDGVEYNRLKHNPAGQPLAWVNPNLDVTNSEAWIAVDDATPALLDVPAIEGRYATVQILDEWGEVITNINERNYPDHPRGRYAFVAPGSRVPTPDGAVRIQLRSPKAKLLARIELRGDTAGAVALQHRLQLRSLGTPTVAAPVALPAFGNDTLIGVELFDHAEELLASAPDVSPVAAQRQVTVRDIAAACADPARRRSIDDVLRASVIPAFQRYAVQGAGIVANQWIGITVTGNYGADVAIRTAANYVGIWANARDEVVYFVTTRDAAGDPLDGARHYVVHFPPDARPEAVVDAYWSLSLVDVPGFVAVPNRIDRYTFNAVAPPPADADGGLTIHLAPDTAAAVPEANWLPTPATGPFSLTFRAYVPTDVVKHGGWFPPAVARQDPG